MKEKNKTVISGVTVEGKPLEVYLDEQENSEIEKVQSQQLREAGRGIKYVPKTILDKNISGKRSEYSNRVEKYSAEVLVHINYLFQLGGEKLVNDFLSKPQTQDGSIESALRDAKEKLVFYTKESVRVEGEKGRWQSVVQQLESALDLVQGRAPSGGATGSGESSLSWNEILQEILANGGVKHKELRRILEEKYPQMKASSIYQGIHTKLKSGVIQKDSNEVVTYVGKQ